MRKHAFTVSIILVFLIGLSVLLYPTVSSYINSLRQSRVVAGYYAGLSRLSERDFTDLLNAAHEYNRKLPGNQNRFVLSDNEMAEYMSLLNPNGNGVMGVLEIGSIDVRLPIYHGTSEGVLQIGAGHIEGTSLPVGETGTHSSVTGHRGLPSSLLLTNLDKLAKGDTFVLRILNQTLTYKVDQILVVDPEEMDPLAIDMDMDYCTVVTCTPYGINSHRMLVRGYRVANAAEDEAVVIFEELAEDGGYSLILLFSAAAFITLIFSIALYKLNKRVLRRVRIHGKGTD